ncbi:hypothetical protein [Streptomyces sp. NPDC093223]|uniref:hypothetical protein n=1 Tax=Streptomyces sp. NPDC093223 TaxID=3366033 RepID=UPI00380D86C4
MSDEFVYRNENTGDIARYPYRSARLEMLPNWVTLSTPKPEGDQEVEPPHGPPAPTDPGTPGPSEQTSAPASPEAPATTPSVEGDGSTPSAPERPAPSALKAEWIAYAKAHAKDSDTEAAIDGLTKEQLIEQYGGDSA